MKAAIWALTLYAIAACAADSDVPASRICQDCGSGADDPPVEDLPVLAGPLAEEDVQRFVGGGVDCGLDRCGGNYVCRGSHTFCVMPANRIGLYCSPDGARCINSDAVPRCYQCYAWQHR